MMKNTAGQKYRSTISGAFAITLLSTGIMSGIAGTAAMASSCDDEQVKSSQQTIDHKTFQVDQVRVDAPKECVWAILTNYPDTPKVYSKVTSCKVVLDEGANKVVAFKVKAFKDLLTLDYSLNVKEKFPSSIEWSRRDGAFKANEGYWHIDPAADGKTCMVTYAKFVDGGNIPQFFVNKELKADMPVILASVKTSAETFYQNTLHEHVVMQPAATRVRTNSAISRKVQSPESGKAVETTTTITLKGPIGNGF